MRVGGVLSVSLMKIEADVHLYVFSALILILGSETRTSWSAWMNGKGSCQLGKKTSCDSLHEKSWCCLTRAVQWLHVYSETPSPLFLSLRQNNNIREIIAIYKSNC